MAAVIPTQLYTGFDLLAATDPAPSQGIFIPLASLTGLSAAEADPATGSGTKLLHALIRIAQQKHEALSTEARSTRMTIRRANPTSGGASNLINTGYTVEFKLDISSVDVADEPS